MSPAKKTISLDAETIGRIVQLHKEVTSDPTGVDHKMVVELLSKMRNLSNEAADRYDKLDRVTYALASITDGLSELERAVRPPKPRKKAVKAV